jgi:hypothetical protein
MLGFKDTKVIAFLHMVGQTLLPELLKNVYTKDLEEHFVMHYSFPLRFFSCLPRELGNLNYEL